jgi:carbamoyltransferase
MVSKRSLAVPDVPVKESQRNALPAITHVDGTGGLQAVFQSQSPRHYSLIQRFGDATGVPVLLNTSFNLKGERTGASVSQPPLHL